MLVQAVLAAALAIPFVFRTRITQLLARVRRDGFRKRDGSS